MLADLKSASHFYKIYKEQLRKLSTFGDLIFSLEWIADGKLIENENIKVQFRM
jgi:hypothetical protein